MAAFVICEVHNFCIIQESEEISECFCNRKEVKYVFWGGYI